MASVKKANFDMVHDIQLAYRIMLNALSYPGQIYELNEINQRLDLSFEYNPSIILLSLIVADSEVSVCVAGDHKNNQEVAKYLRNRVYTPIAKQKDADYLIISSKSDQEVYLEGIATGTLIDPHRTTTVFVEVDEITNQKDLLLTGSGIKESIQLEILGLTDQFIQKRNDLCGEFPLGFDLFLCDKNGKIVGIPRTTKIEKESGSWHM